MLFLPDRPGKLRPGRSIAAPLQLGGETAVMEVLSQRGCDFGEMRDRRNNPGCANAKFGGLFRLTRICLTRICRPESADPYLP